MYRRPNVWEREEQPNYLLDYMDPLKITSLTDVFFNVRGAAQYTGGKYIPGVSNALAGVNFLKDAFIKPLFAGDMQSFMMNSLQALSKDMDIDSNPIKGAIIEGHRGFQEGGVLGGIEGMHKGLERGLFGDEDGRQYYLLDSGYWVLDLAFEVATSPINWFTFGMKSKLQTMAQGGMEALGRSVLKEQLPPRIYRKMGKFVNSQMLEGVTAKDAMAKAMRTFAGPDNFKSANHLVKAKGTLEGQITRRVGMTATVLESLSSQQKTVRSIQTTLFRVGMLGNPVSGPLYVGGKMFKDPVIDLLIKNRAAKGQATQIDLGRTLTNKMDEKQFTAMAPTEFASMAFSIQDGQKIAYQRVAKQLGIEFQDMPSMDRVLRRLDVFMERAAKENLMEGTPEFNRALREFYNSRKLWGFTLTEAHDDIFDYLLHMRSWETGYVQGLAESVARLRVHAADVLRKLKDDANRPLEDRIKYLNPLIEQLPREMKLDQFFQEVAHAGQLLDHLDHRVPDLKRLIADYANIQLQIYQPNALLNLHSAGRAGWKPQIDGIQEGLDQYSKTLNELKRIALTPEQLVDSIEHQSDVVYQAMLSPRMARLMQLQSSGDFLEYMEVLNSDLNTGYFLGQGYDARKVHAAMAMRGLASGAHQPGATPIHHAAKDQLDLAKSIGNYFGISEELKKIGLPASFPEAAMDTLEKISHMDPSKALRTHADFDRVMNDFVDQVHRKVNGEKAVKHLTLDHMFETATGGKLRQYNAPSQADAQVDIFKHMVRQGELDMDPQLEYLSMKIKTTGMKLDKSDQIYEIALTDVRTGSTAYFPMKVDAALHPDVARRAARDGQLFSELPETMSEYRQMEALREYLQEFQASSGHDIRLVMHGGADEFKFLSIRGSAPQMGTFVGDYPVLDLREVKLQLTTSMKTLSEGEEFMLRQSMRNYFQQQADLKMPLISTTPPIDFTGLYAGSLNKESIQGSEKVFQALDKLLDSSKVSPKLQDAVEWDPNKLREMLTEYTDDVFNQLTRGLGEFGEMQGQMDSVFFKASDLHDLAGHRNIFAYLQNTLPDGKVVNIFEESPLAVKKMIDPYVRPGFVPPQGASMKTQMYFLEADREYQKIYDQLKPAAGLELRADDFRELLTDLLQYSDDGLARYVYNNVGPHSEPYQLAAWYQVLRDRNLIQVNELPNLGRDALVRMGDFDQMMDHRILGSRGIGDLSPQAINDKLDALHDLDHVEALLDAQKRMTELQEFLSKPIKDWDQLLDTTREIVHDGLTGLKLRKRTIDAALSLHEKEVTLYSRIGIKETSPTLKIQVGENSYTIGRKNFRAVVPTEGWQATYETGRAKLPKEVSIQRIQEAKLKVRQFTQEQAAYREQVETEKMRLARDSARLREQLTDEIKTKMGVGEDPPLEVLKMIQHDIQMDPRFQRDIQRTKKVGITHARKTRELAQKVREAEQLFQHENDIMSRSGLTVRATNAVEQERKFFKINRSRKEYGQHLAKSETELILRMSPHQLQRHMAHYSPVMVIPHGKGRYETLLNRLQRDFGVKDLGISVHRTDDVTYLVLKSSPEDLAQIPMNQMRLEAMPYSVKKSDPLYELIHELRKSDEVMTEAVRGKKALGVDSMVGDVISYKNFMDTVYMKLPESVRKETWSELQWRNWFNEEIRFNHIVLGDLIDRKHMNPYLNMNPFRNRQRALSEAALRQNYKEKYLQLFFNKEYSIKDSPLTKGMTDQHIFDILKTNRELTLSYLRKTKKGFDIQEIKPTSLRAIQIAREKEAIFLPLDVLHTAHKTVNVKNYPADWMEKYYRYGVSTYKVGYLTSVGFPVRNLLDSIVKNTISMDDPLELPNTVRNLFRAWEANKDYDRHIKNILEEFGTWNRKALDEYFARFPDTVRTKFDVVHSLNISPAGAGYTKSLSDYFRNINNAGAEVTLFENILYDKFWPSKWMFSATSMVERSSRLGLEFQLAEAGFGKSSRYAKIIAAHFDYGKKSVAEFYGQLLFPFVTFGVRNFAFWDNVLETKPWAIRTMTQAHRAMWQYPLMDREELNRNGALKWHILSGSIPLGNVALKMNPSLFEVFRLVNNPAEEFEQRLFTPLTQAFNHVTGRNIDPDTGEPKKLELELPYQYSSQRAQRNLTETLPDVLRGEKSPALLLPSLFSSMPRTWEPREFTPERRFHTSSRVQQSRSPRPRRTYYRMRYAERMRYRSYSNPRLGRGKFFYNDLYTKTGASRMKLAQIPPYKRRLQAQIKSTFHMFR